MWEAFAAIAAGAAAAFAGAQIYISRRDANHRAVFEHLREVDARLQRAWRCPTPRARDELLRYYRGDTDELTDAAEAYLSLLNSLDLLAFAIQKELVDRESVTEYLRTLLTPDLVSLTFIQELRECCGEDRVYEHLASYLASVRWDRAGPRIARS